MCRSRSATSVISRTLLAAFALAAAGAACAQSVSLNGRMGSKALLIVDGSAPKALGAGETFQGVKLLSIQGETAVIEIGGQQQTLRIGEAPSRVGATAGSGADKIVLTAGEGGHFITDGRINGQQSRMMVDTGATIVSMSVDQATRLGIKFQDGRMAMASTANGQVPMWLVKLDTVRIGEMEVRNVDAAITPAQMPYVLLGNSFLDRFQMKRENNLMVLERRY